MTDATAAASHALRHCWQEDEPDDEEAAEKAVAKEDNMNKVLMQAFTLTFLAEWGDRSQIATIALV